MQIDKINIPWQVAVIAGLAAVTFGINLYFIFLLWRHQDKFEGLDASERIKSFWRSVDSGNIQGLRYIVFIGYTRWILFGLSALSFLVVFAIDYVMRS